MIYLQLFFEFFKTGLFAVGGGMATVPFLTDMAGKTGWFSQQQLVDMIAVSESTPGPIGVNMATYVGFTTAGVLGGIVATLGLVTPSVIVILIIAAFLKKFRENKYVDRVFYGVRPASTALIASAGFSILLMCLVNVDAWKESGKITDLISIRAVILAIVVWVLTNKIKFTKKLHPLCFIALSAVAGIVFSFAGV
ncbi:MAG: chromate transporter [Oscillospiraceae bacterium]|nr:chromate transporter [Oscillospiraceae bacterium]MBR5261694.1 chromate transporter [Oscillospiraceae bacterium]